MGIALPRAAANHIVMRRDTDILLNYLNKTHMPYETFWATVAGNKRGRFKKRIKRHPGHFLAAFCWLIWCESASKGNHLRSNKVTPMVSFRGTRIKVQGSRDWIVPLQRDQWGMEPFCLVNLPSCPMGLKVAFSTKVLFSDLKAPGSFFGQDLIYLQQKYQGKKPDVWQQTPEMVGKSSIARIEVSYTKQYCDGTVIPFKVKLFLFVSENPLCYFTIDDIPFLLSRPELMAHKIFMTIQPAAYICLAKVSQPVSMFYCR